MPNKVIKFGEILLQSERINAFQLDSALSYQRNCGGRLGESLIKLGYISEEELLQCLAQQLKLPRIDLFKHDVSGDVLNCIPAEKAREHNILPVDRKELHGTSYLLVAMSDPTNLHLLDALQFMSGCRVKPVLAPASDIRDAIRHYYDLSGADAVPPLTNEKPVPRRPPAFPEAAAAETSADAKLQALLRVLLDKGFLTLREYERLK